MKNRNWFLSLVVATWKRCQIYREALVAVLFAVAINFGAIWFVMYLISKSTQS